MKIFKTFLFITILCFLFGFDSYESNGKRQMIVFEGSDWCVNCRKFEKNILKDSLFIDFLNQNEINLEKVDFPQRKQLSEHQRKHNEAMADKYDFNGKFPTIVLARLDSFKYEKFYFLNQSVEEMILQIQEKMKNLK